MSKEEKLKCLLTWATDNDAYVDPRIEFRYSEESGISAFYKSDSSNGRIVVKIPEKLILTPLDAEKHFGIVSGDKDGIDSTTLLKFYLIELRRQKSDSFYAPYLSSLPGLREIGSPLGFSPPELELLNGTNVYHGVQSKLQGLIIDYERGLKELGIENLKHYSQMDKVELYKNIILEVNSQNCESYTFGWFLWAHLILTSRAFPYKLVNRDSDNQSVMLLPVVDLLNHKAGAKVSWLGNKDSFELQIDEDPYGEAGLEIFNNYGPKGNEELFMGYGFTIDDNEFETLTLSLDIGSVSDDLTEALRKNEWKISLPKLEDYTYSVHDSLDSTKTDTHQEDMIIEVPNKVVFVCNNDHLLPDGLLELFSFMSKNDDDQYETLKSAFNGLNKLKSALDTKFKGKLEKLTSLPESVIFESTKLDENFEESYRQNYLNVKSYKKGQLQILKKIKGEIKSTEKQLLKKFRKQLITIKDILKKEESFHSILELFKLDDYSVEDMNKYDMELVVHAWMLKSVNEDLEDTISAGWIKQEFEKGVTESNDPQFIEMYEESIGPAIKNSPHLFEGSHWTLSDFLKIHTIYERNSYEKGSTLEPIIIQPTKMN
ncbi:hypothetical protein CANARDRAFT_7556 [[Candida] arabinofermentans NRRL YB-2248]|uniref:SET domain-containing protein n=1 Tax=[Candida] arabinofermentans NRRL YB-2248 TaxID=983967 RepID=A0A1E4T148_9ASCO|nr:hypothetical protein CANARDRAFT_7556 [[Candida] arabinofermentans NRRL YB-2248]